MNNQFNELTRAQNEVSASSAGHVKAIVPVNTL